MKPAARLGQVGSFGIDRVAAAAGADPAVLRLENLDTDLRPPPAAIVATQRALEDDDANSYLPFDGSRALRAEIAARLERQTGHEYDEQCVVITCGGTEGMFDALLATVDAGDEVLLTDPTYAGMINRVRMAQGEPRFCSLIPGPAGWRLEVDELRRSVTRRTKALFLMNPSMPSGAVLTREQWDAVADICDRADLLLIYNAAMERIVFDSLPVIHPAAIPALADRTLIVGSMSKEFRMIGWRIGWVAGPRDLIGAVRRAHLYNVVSPPGISQAAALAALREPDDEFEMCRLEWQRRRDVLMTQLSDYEVVQPSGGWSALMDVRPLGIGANDASEVMLTKGKIAATPMTGWGPTVAERYVRLVFSNEPVTRLGGLAERLRACFGTA